MKVHTTSGMPGHVMAIRTFPTGMAAASAAENPLLT